ncbi:MAG: GxxExxY protein [Bacteroidota bacterium]
MLENVYETCLAYKLRQHGLFVETEKPVPVIFKKLKWSAATGLTSR